MTNKQLKKQESSHLVTGSLIIAFMLFIPYAFYIYNYVPDVEIYETRWFTFESNYYDSVRYSVWAFLSKLIPTFLLLIWFTTCKHWWYYSIAIPISVYIFQLISVLNDDLIFSDEFEFIYSLPITIIIIAILLLVRSKIGVFLKAKDIKKQMDEQMNKPFAKKGDFK